MAETVYLYEAQEFINTMERNNENLINALTTSINNLAMNTGNRTTREYNELKKKYTELENKYKKSDCILKSIITMYTFVIYNYNHLDMPLDSDKIIEIMDSNYADIQNHQKEFMPNVMYEKIINMGNEVYEKLIGR